MISLSAGQDVAGRRCHAWNPEAAERPFEKMVSAKEANMQSSYTIRFDFPEGVTVYGGKYQGACGFAHTLATADIFNDPEEAKRLLDNGYGPAMNRWGRVVPVKA